MTTSSEPPMSTLMWLNSDGTEDLPRNTVRAAARRLRFGTLERMVLALAEDYVIKYPEWFDDLDWSEPATAFRTVARLVEHAPSTDSDLTAFDAFVAARALRCAALVLETRPDSDPDPDA